MNEALSHSRETGPEEPSLTFDWSRKGGGKVYRIALLLVFSLLAHAFLFYLFRVVYPASERIVPSPARIVLLSKSDPYSRELLREVEDRVVFFDPGARAGQDPAGDYAVAFRPSFAGYPLTLRMSEPPVRHDGLPEPFASRQPVLPEPEPVAGASNASGDLMGREADRAREAPAIRPGAALEGRPVTVAGEWAWVRERLAEFEGRQAELVIAVRPQGRIQHVLINRGIDAAVDDRLAATVRGIRFAPRSGGGLVWETIRLQW